MRKIGDTPMHQEALKEHIEYVEKLGAKDIRVDQCQTNIDGKLVGKNRPDLQYTLGDERHTVEFDRMSSNRGLNHEIRTQANDPSAIVTLMQMG